MNAKQFKINRARLVDGLFGQEILLIRAIRVYGRGTFGHRVHKYFATALASYLLLFKQGEQILFCNPFQMMIPAIMGKPAPSSKKLLLFTSFFVIVAILVAPVELIRTARECARVTDSMKCDN